MSEESFRIPVSNISRDMILSKDVITQDGTVLISANTPLDNVNIRKLRAFDIEYVMVRPAVPKRLIKVRRAPKVVEQAEFQNFEARHRQRADEYKSLVRDISAGKRIDISELYKISDGVMQSLKLKSDVFTFLNSMRQADEHIYTHSVNVSILCNIFANWLKLNPKAVSELTVAGLLHDIGMSGIPSEILNKKEPLTAEEAELIEGHTTAGYRLIMNQALPNTVKAAVLMHHERMDGSGYPNKVTSGKVSPYAKILSICDVYDAMTSDRAYREKIQPFKVMRTLETGMYSELDARYLLIFLQHIAYNYLGSWVRLSDGRSAEIMFIHRLNISKPIVRTAEDELIDLSARQELEIEQLL